MEKLEFELIVLKGFDVLALTFVQLEAVCEEVDSLKAILVATQTMLEVIENESIVMYLRSKTLSVSIQSFRTRNLSQPIMM